MHIETVIILVVIGFIVIIVFASQGKGGCISCREGLSWRVNDCDPPNYTQPGMWFDYHNPSIRAENTYWNDALGKGLPCGDEIYSLESSRLNAFKRGYKDHADYVCEGLGLLPGTHEYNRCLTEVYSDYKYP